MTKRLPRYEMDVECNRYCQGGRAKADQVEPLNGDYAATDEWCRASDVAELEERAQEMYELLEHICFTGEGQSEIAELLARIDNPKEDS